MDALPLADATRRLGAPQQWNHESDGICHTLEIRDADGWMVSAWRPTDAELTRLNDGAPVYLWIAGTVHPVVALFVAEQAPPPAGDEP